jgi:hypothetical protein
LSAERAGGIILSHGLFGAPEGGVGAGASALKLDWFENASEEKLNSYSEHQSSKSQQLR